MFQHAVATVLVLQILKHATQLITRDSVNANKAHVPECAPKSAQVGIGTKSEMSTIFS